VTDGNKVITFGPTEAGFDELFGYQWTNATTPSAPLTGFDANGNILGIRGGVVWLRIVQTVSARTYFASADGVNFVQQTTTGNTSFLTSTGYGLYIRGSSANGTGSMLSFTETTP
jgi:hypothetical protein